MPIVIEELENLGKSGINSDVTPWSMPPEFLTDGRNFRVFANSISASGGYADWVASPVQFDPGFLMEVVSSVGINWVVAGRSAVYAYTGSTWIDISSTAGYSGIGTDDELLWTGSMLGKIPVFNNPQSQPEYWLPDNSSQPLQPLPFDATNTWKDKGYTCAVMRSHNDFLFALNLVEGSQELKGTYRWSHPADIDGLPFSWDDTDKNTLAGKAQIGGESGAIVDGLSLRDSFVIYSETAINILDFTGDEFVFRRRQLSGTLGLISSNAIVEVKGKHFFLSDGDILVNDGNNIDSILHNRLRKKFTSSINTDTYYRSYAVRNTTLKEIWFCIPESGYEYPNVAYIYNWKDNTWVIRDLPALQTDGSGDEVTYANYGQQAKPTLAWSDWSGDWDSQIRTWGNRTRTPLNNTIIGVTRDAKLLILDPGDVVGTNITNINTFIERTDFPLLGHNEVTSIVYIIPHVRGTSSLIFQFGAQDFAGGPVRWSEELTFTPGIDRKLDVRVTGELMAYRVKSIGIGTWELSGMTVAYVPNGER